MSLYVYMCEYVFVRTYDVYRGREKYGKRNGQMPNNAPSYGLGPQQLDEYQKTWRPNHSNIVFHVG